MTAPNHALTGAVIGLAVANPLAAAGLAFLSHFMCDAIPHYDPPGPDGVARLSSRRFLYEFLVVGAVLCLGIVLLLAVARPQHWFTAALCAFLATSPDLFWIPRFIQARSKGTERPTRNWFLRLHAWVQWKTGEKLIWVEAVWFFVFGTLLIHSL